MTTVGGVTGVRFIRTSGASSPEEVLRRVGITNFTIAEKEDYIPFKADQEADKEREDREMGEVVEEKVEKKVEDKVEEKIEDKVEEKVKGEEEEDGEEWDETKEVQ
ncbi:hypothetical protein IAU60_003837 [Kwoniella sp. DSM 27419]